MNSESETWWIQTLVSLGSPCSPRVMGLHSVEATGEDDAVHRLSARLEAPTTPAPAVLPKIQREAQARGAEDDDTIKILSTTVIEALDSEPKGLVITAISTDFAAVSGFDTVMGPRTELSEAHRAAA